MEVLTHELIELEFVSIVETKSKVQGDGVERWSWDFVVQPFAHPMLENIPAPGVAGDLDAFRFSSNDAAWNYAMGWIRRNRPQWWRAAKHEAEDGVRYRNLQKSRAKQAA